MWWSGWRTGRRPRPVVNAASHCMEEVGNEMEFLLYKPEFGDVAALKKGN